MPLGYKFYRDSWIKLSILSVGLGAFLWAYAHGEAKAEPGVVSLVITLAVVGHAALLTLMFRAKRKEAEAAHAALGLPAEPKLHEPVPEPPPGVFQKELSSRAIGVVLTLCGLGLGYLSVIMPIRDAAAHSASVSIELKGCLLAPFLLVIGLLYALLPVQMVRFTGPPQSPRPRAWLLYVPLLLLGVVLYHQVQQMVEGYGYSFK